MECERSMEDIEHLVAQAKLLIRRLERISADSIWARRSSGQRGALLKWVEAYEGQGGADGERQGDGEIETGNLERILADSYRLLEKAAREYPVEAQ